MISGPSSIQTLQIIVCYAVQSLIEESKQQEHDKTCQLYSTTEGSRSSSPQSVQHQNHEQTASCSILIAIWHPFLMGRACLIPFPEDLAAIPVDNSIQPL